MVLFRGIVILLGCSLGTRGLPHHNIIRTMAAMELGTIMAPSSKDELRPLRESSDGPAGEACQCSTWNHKR